METRNAHWETEAKNYMAIIQKDLLGHWVVFCQWGVKQSRHGGKKIIPVKSFEMGLIGQYVPKETNFNLIYEEMIDKVENEIIMDLEIV